MTPATYTAIAREAYPTVSQMVAEAHPSLEEIEIEAGWRRRPRSPRTPDLQPKEQK